jgi:large subunit ribosomal protein L35
MPKPKTKKSVKKRFKVTKNGKVLMSRAGRGHLLSKKSAKKRRKLRKKQVAAPQDAKKLKRMLGGGS